MFGKLCATVITVVMVILSSRVQADTVAAVPANDFVESIGVQTQLNFSGIWVSPAWRARLGELGIRYVRTELGRSSRARDHLNALYRDYGVRAHALVQPRKPDGSLNLTMVQPFLDFLREDIGVEKLISVEGPNEYSLTKYEDGNTDWAAEVRNFQRHLFTSVKTDPALKSLLVVGPTIWHEFESDYREQGNLGAYADRGNFHYYNGARKPTLYGRETHYQVPFVSIESPIDMAISNARITTPNKRVFVTETGFNMRLPSAPYYTPERTAAKYTLRLVAELFLRRNLVEKAFIFSLFDASPDKVYGLLRNDLSRRPAFYALKNANAILSDRGPAFSPDDLTYTLVGDRTDIRAIVLQKRNKRFYMLIWNDAVSYVRKDKLEVTPPPRRLTLNISGHQFSQLNIYHPTGLGLPNPDLGRVPIRTIVLPLSVAIDVPDHVMILEMIP